MISSSQSPVRKHRDCAARRGRGAAAGWSHFTWLLVAVCIVLVGGARADDRDVTFVETQEGRRLVVLWHAMLDHSGDAVYSPELFRELGASFEVADADFAALAERGVLSQPRSEQLRALFHTRYRYIQECHYSNRSTIRVTGVAASRTTAQWVVELQLSILRRQPTSKADEYLAEAAMGNLAYELTFLHHLDAFEEESDRRRMALMDKQTAGEDVDLEGFEKEYQYRRSRLLEAYRNKRLPKVASVNELVPYIVALTRARPLPHTARGESLRLGS